MPRRCTVCKHPEIDAINKHIARGATVRDIAGRYALVSASVHRHTESCLQIDLAVAQKARGFNFANELFKHYEKALKMLAAVEEWLQDPDDPEKYNIDPRDNEIDVVYLDHNDLGDNGKPKKKSGRLSDLLKDLYEGTEKDAIAVYSKAEDSRKLFHTSLKTITDRLDQMAKHFGFYQQDRPNDEVIGGLVRAFERLAAEARERAGRDLTEPEKDQIIMWLLKKGSVPVGEAVLRTAIRAREIAQESTMVS